MSRALWRGCGGWQVRRQEGEGKRQKCCDERNKGRRIRGRVPQELCSKSVKQRGLNGNMKGYVAGPGGSTAWVHRTRARAGGRSLDSV